VVGEFGVGRPCGEEVLDLVLWLAVIEEVELSAVKGTDEAQSPTAPSPQAAPAEPRR
jgi:hypothetical protein